MVNYSFVFIISSYNNENNIHNNLMSILCQSYTNWRAIYINDCSTDHTHALFQEFVQKHNVSHKFTYIQNTKREYQSHNKYHAYK